MFIIFFYSIDSLSEQFSTLIALSSMLPIGDYITFPGVAALASIVILRITQKNISYVDCLYSLNTTNVFHGNSSSTNLTMYWNAFALKPFPI